jgi:hypothetical protein
MLTITVNGQEEKLNIGCRTFIALDEILKLLNASSQDVIYNGEMVSSIDCGKITVSGGDKLGLTFVESN